MSTHAATIQLPRLTTALRQGGGNGW